MPKPTDLTPTPAPAAPYGRRRAATIAVTAVTPSHRLPATRARGYSRGR